MDFILQEVHFLLPSIFVFSISLAGKLRAPSSSMQAVGLPVLTVQLCRVIK